MSLNTKVSDTFWHLVRASKTGALVCESGHVKRLLFFEQGQIVGCRASRPEERVGEIMVREGRLTPEQLRCTAEHIRSGRKMGAIMVELGYLKGGEIEGYLRLQILEVASQILLHPCDRLAFSDEVRVDAVTLTPVLVPEVFIEAARRLEDVQHDREHVFTADFLPIRVAQPEVPAERLNLSRDELTVLNLVDSFSTARDILKSTSVDPESALRTLIGLLHAGIIDQAPLVSAEVLVEVGETDAQGDLEMELAQAYGQARDKDHWGVLGLERGADFSRVQQAYEELRAKFAPEKYAQMPGSALKVSFIGARVKDAFLTLSAQSQSMAYVKLVDREQEYESLREDWEQPASESAPLPKDSATAKRMFERAKEAFREKDYWSAIQLCRAAIELNETNEADHYHLLGAALVHNPRWRKDAEKHLKIATQLKPWDPRYLVTLARFYHREGLGELAQQLLGRVKAIDPDHPTPSLPDLDEHPPQRVATRNVVRLVIP